jgi:hypothetical protein
VDVRRLRKEVEGLEGERHRAEDEHEREKRLKMVREAAEQANERFYRYLAIERRKAFLESVGYEGHSAEDLRDENFLYPDDKPPFEITPEGVFSSRDGKPITEYPQTLGEVWYWEEVDEGEMHLIHDEQAQAFYTPSGELALSRDRVDLRHYFAGIRPLEEEIQRIDREIEELEGEA